MVESEGDGFCFFHSVRTVLSQETDMEPIDVKNLANEVLKHMAQNWEEYQAFCTTSADEMIRSAQMYFLTGNYARNVVDLIIAATCKLLDINLRIYRQDNRKLRIL